MASQPSLAPPGPRRMSKPQLPAPPSPAASSDLDLGPDDDLDGDDPLGGLPLELDPTFQREPASDVRIVCGRTTFWAHGVFLRFSSDWFRAVLEGDWAESQPLSDSDSVLFAVPASPGAPSAPAPVPAAAATGALSGKEERARRRSSFLAAGSNATTSSDDYDDGDDGEGPSDTSVGSPSASADADVSALLLSSPPPAPSHEESERERERKDSQATAVVRVRQARSYITVSLPPAEAAPLHDYLHHVYPHLTLQITWLNVEALAVFASKYQIPTLQPLLSSFLLSHCPGRPLSALLLATRLASPVLYAEASRFVLDNLPHWPADEYMRLGGETRWRLERRRGWFLDRVLKMGLVEVERDYICHPACPHPAQCAKTLDARFRQAYAGAFRFGAPQPSVVFRSLRSLSLPHQPAVLPLTVCNATAAAWVADLFDRMFELPLTATAGVPDDRARFFLTVKLADD